MPPLVRASRPCFHGLLFPLRFRAGHGGASTVKGNMIRDGSGGSLLCLSPQSSGLICANVIDQDASATLQVPDGLLPEVQEQNLIRFIGQVSPHPFAPQSPPPRVRLLLS